jgi:hypothetical protein
VEVVTVFGLGLVFATACIGDRLGSVFVEVAEPPCCVDVVLTLARSPVAWLLAPQAARPMARAKLAATVLRLI